MIKRIVKMSFHPEKIAEFLANFEMVKDQIRGFEGCEHLEMFRALTPHHIIFTYSYWRSEDHLNAYRHSELFADTWAKTKALFNDKPEAWSVEVLYDLP